ncbi:MAG: PstS family phosphate ABC transporter substrate-binding protein [Spirochaetaceae bacterium]|nr:MAG: PstS family phosphate ABC transporter substrate-binding protein [Spirochaetaceae bacterium]
MKKKLVLLLIIAAVCFSCEQMPERIPAISDSVAPYSFSPELEGRLEGQIVVVGSDTMSNIITLLSAGFSAIHADVSWQTDFSGSELAPVALLSGQADLASMSRPLSDSEIAMIRQTYGAEPVEVVLARDAIVVMVNPSNPLSKITLSELARIYRPVRDKNDRLWNSYGVVGYLADKQIDVTGRTEDSGTNHVFSRLVLETGGITAGNYRGLAGSSALVEYIASNPSSIGYAGAGFVTTGVKVLALADDLTASSGDFFLPDAKHVLNGDYPLARSLYLYAVPNSSGKLKAEVEAFLSYALSRQGQQIILEDGLYPPGAELE